MEKPALSNLEWLKKSRSKKEVARVLGYAAACAAKDEDVDINEFIEFRDKCQEYFAEWLDEKHK